MSFASVGFIGLLVLPGLSIIASDGRRLPAYVAIAGDIHGGAWLGRHILCLQGKQLFLRDHRIGRDQRVISTGPLRLGTAPDVCGGAW